MFFTILFWICFLCEGGILIWWLLDEMKLQYLEPNPYVFVCILYFAIACIVRFLVKAKLVGSLMIIVPGVPIILWLLLIMLFAGSGTKWN